MILIEKNASIRQVYHKVFTLFQRKSLVRIFQEQIRKLLLGKVRQVSPTSRDIHTVDKVTHTIADDTYLGLHLNGGESLAGGKSVLRTGEMCLTYIGHISKVLRSVTQCYATKIEA